ncbi:toprim domain-containing protein [Chryseobacterium mulctrae]|uniref:toprim domain-containing protein n=1 Tax=Chryseobacterium mulctrae TaxID=2576777 RepID=UPI001116FB0B|nr:toprim domain-containing protein [Chryseobacterium mulctrae]
MNCQDIKTRVGIRVLLESFNIFPVKENQRTAFYFALDRKEKVPSLAVDFMKNTAFDFGTGKSYDVISIVQIINRCSVSEALKYFSRFDFSLLNSEEKIGSIVQKHYEIIKTIDIKHSALIQYLQLRKVYEQQDLVTEIHYKMNNKKFFGIGFKNNSGGFEIRSKYSKLCLGKKDVTLVKNDLNSGKEIILFEGFFDYLTYRAINILNDETADYLILNSTAMFFKVENELFGYNKIFLFLDNDDNGKTIKQMVQKKYKNVEDCSILYSDYKDMNEWYCKQH